MNTQVTASGRELTYCDRFRAVRFSFGKQIPPANDLFVRQDELGHRLKGGQHRRIDGIPGARVWRVTLTLAISEHPSSEIPLLFKERCSSVLLVRNAWRRKDFSDGMEAFFVSVLLPWRWPRPQRHRSCCRTYPGSAKSCPRSESLPGVGRSCSIPQQKCRRTSAAVS